MFRRFRIEEDDSKPGVVPGAEDEDRTMSAYPMLAYLSTEAAIAQRAIDLFNERRGENEARANVKVFPCADLMVGGEACRSKLQGAPADVMMAIGALAYFGEHGLLSAER
jgi:hypothetical protein